MSKELSYLIVFVFSIYLTGYAIYSNLFKTIFSKNNIFINIAVSWIFGNFFFSYLLYILAFSNNLDFVKMPHLLYLDFLMLLISGISLLRKRYKGTESLKNLIVLILFILFFIPLIKDSLYSYLIGWDAIAIWMFKAKSFFYSNGIWNNPIFLESKALVYSHKDYPLGIPLLAASYYRLIGAVNDQLIQFYFLNFYFCIILVFYGFMKKFLSVLSSPFSFILTLTLFILPNMMIYAHNGYADIPLSAVIAVALVLFLSLYEETESQLKTDYFKLLIPVSATATVIKSEGYSFFVLIILLSSTVLFASFKKNFKQVFSYKNLISFLILIVFSVIPLLIWEYIKANLNSHSYLQDARLFPNLFSRLKLIAYVYIDEFINVNKYSLASIPIMLLFTMQIILFIIHKKLKSLIPFVLILLQLGVYTLVYLVTPVDLEWQLRSSFERLWIHVLPAFYISVLYQMRDFFKLFFAKGIKYRSN